MIETDSEPEPLAALLQEAQMLLFIYAGCTRGLQPGVNDTYYEPEREPGSEMSCRESGSAEKAKPGAGECPCVESQTRKTNICIAVSHRQHR